MRCNQLLPVTALAVVARAAYVLEDDYQPDNFFDGFDFTPGPDANNGFVTYLDRSTAEEQQLASTEDGTIYMGVGTGDPGDKGRSSIKIESKKTYGGGLILLDAAHMPGGVCGTWPAFWSVGPNWPEDGELDIIEGINSQEGNIIAGHTMEGCTIEKSNDFTAELLTDNCWIDAPDQDSNQGCHFQDHDPATYGTGFNDAGGGVYAMEWTSDFISIWFFPRDRIPPDVSSGNPDPSGWTTPNAYLSGDCDFKEKLIEQRLIINTALCGDWPDSKWAEDPVCSAKAPTCKEYVANNPEAFEEAYWEINYMKVFQQGTAEPSASSDPSPSTPPSTATPTSEPVAEDPSTPAAPSPTAPGDSGGEQPVATIAPPNYESPGDGAPPAPSPPPEQASCPVPEPKPSCTTYVTTIVHDI